jgi:hypothetical protein
MDGSRFDAWTRRRFGLATGGLATLVAGLYAAASGFAKKKRKRRCKKLGFSNCKTSGKRRRCCKGLGCDRPGMSLVRHCCLPIRRLCDDTVEDPQQCCGETVCETISGLDGHRCCVFPGDQCMDTSECCFTGICVSGTCVDPPP